jgi:hypothetical protein
LSVNRLVPLTSIRPLVLLACLAVVSCGGGNNLNGPGAGNASSAGGKTGSKEGDGSGGGGTEKKKESKYPEPWLEPDCGTVGTDGYLPDAKNVVVQVHKAGWDKLKQCVDDVNDVHGEVRVQFRLDPDGTPRCVEAPGSSMDNEEVIKCVIAVYRTFHYPSPKNGSVRVTDGIEFDVSEGDEDD